MNCAELEDRLLEYGELPADSRAAVDRHLSGCTGCREFFDVLGQADAALAAAVAGVRPGPGFRAAILRQVETRPSWIPEVLDFVGWAAMLAACAGVLRAVLPPMG